MTLKTVQEIEQFLERIHGNLEGYAIVGTNNQGPNSGMHLTAFSSPKNRTRVARAIAANSIKFDVYYTPSLFATREEVNNRSNFKQSKFLYLDVDDKQLGNALSNLNGIPSPSLVIQTSEGNGHLYWELDEPIMDADILERANRGIAENIGIGDFTTWDSSQLLRLPGTFNHKRSTTFRVSVSKNTKDQFSLSTFPVVLGDSPSEYIQDIRFDSVPDYEQVVSKHNFNTEIRNAINNNPVVGERSDALFHLGMALIQYTRGITDEEVYSILQRKDDEWGKYGAKQDKDYQRKELARIIFKARKKFHDNVYEETSGIPAYTPAQLQLITRFKPNFVYEHFVTAHNITTIASDPGVGKTYFAMGMGVSAMLGHDYVGVAFNNELEINPYYITMEMNDDQALYYISNIESNYQGNSLARIHNEFRISTFPSSSSLLDEDIRKNVTKAIKKFERNFIIIDSFWSTGGESDRRGEYFSFLRDIIVRELKCTVLVLAHTRKPSLETPRVKTKLSDVYGDVQNTAMIDAVMAFDRVKDTHNRMIHSLKTRRGIEFNEFVVERNGKFMYDRIKEEKKEVKSNESASTDSAVSRYNT